MKAFYSIVIAANSEKTFNCENGSPCVISDLDPYNAYTLQLAVYNGKGIGPKSKSVPFTTPEGSK